MTKPKVTADLRKLKAQLKEVPTERQPIANSLYGELVFMQNTLDTLKQQVNEEGAVNMFVQGKQQFLREHPALKAYNTTIQRYSLIYKQIIDLLPKAPEKGTGDALLDFLNKGES